VSEHASVRFTLLDQQLVDADGLPIGRIDDLELTVPDGRGEPTLDYVLTGLQALGERLGGRLGGWAAATSRRLRPRSEPAGPTRVDAELIAELEPLVKLSVPLRDLKGVAGLERWLARTIVERLPGAGDADH
jgi:hypothetical protein